MTIYELSMILVAAGALAVSIFIFVSGSVKDKQRFEQISTNLAERGVAIPTRPEATVAPQGRLRERGGKKGGRGLARGAERFLDGEAVLFRTAVGEYWGFGGAAGFVVALTAFGMYRGAKQGWGATPPIGWLLGFAGASVAVIVLVWLWTSLVGGNWFLYITRTRLVVVRSTVLGTPRRLEAAAPREDVRITQEKETVRGTRLDLLVRGRRIRVLLPAAEAARLKSLLGEA